MKLTVLMDNSYSWEGTPYIALNEQQLLHLATRFDISLAKAKEVVVARELGLYLKEYCLRTYSIS